jgi:hypothetical protein
MNSSVAELLTMDILLDSRHAASLTKMADRNSTQGLAVIQNTVIQSVGATTDDAQLFAAMQTANQTPVAGRNFGPSQ